jgi:hypothetical protein
VAEENGRDARAAGAPKPKLAAHDDALCAQVTSEPDATLAELQAWLIEKRGIKVSIGCFWKRLRHLGLTLKKSPCAPQSKPGPMSRRRARNGVRASPICWSVVLTVALYPLYDWLAAVFRGWRRLAAASITIAGFLVAWEEPFQINDRRCRERFKQGPKDAERAVADTVGWAKAHYALR